MIFRHERFGYGHADRSLRATRWWELKFGGDVFTVSLVQATVSKPGVRKWNGKGLCVGFCGLFC
jgi:hypothetical protein